MKSFLYKAFWKGKQKWLIFFSTIFFSLWLFAYFSLFFIKETCSLEDSKCIDFWLHTIGTPFYWGAFLKVLFISPLLLLPSSYLVFRIWLYFSSVAIPLGFYSILSTPLNATWFDNLAMSGVWGLVYLVGTVAIIVFVSIGEWAYKQYKKK